VHDILWEGGGREFGSGYQTVLHARTFVELRFFQGVFLGTVWEVGHVFLVFGVLLTNNLELLKLETLT